MVTASYTIEMEFSAGIWTSVMADVDANTLITIRRGLDPWERVAAIGQLTFKLHNLDNKYSPDHASAQAGFDIGTPVRIKATYGGSTYPLFRGTIVDIFPSPGLLGERKTAVVAYDDMDKLDRRKLKRLSLQTNQRSDQIVSAIISNAMTPVATDYDTGNDTYAFAGDTWRDEETSARQAVTDVVRSEWGTFHIEGDGTMNFRSRQSRSLNAIIDLALAGGWLVGQLEVSRKRSRVANIVEAQVIPRRTGTAATVMWTLEDIPAIGPGQSRTFVAAYTDPDLEAARVGGQSMISPVATTDYTMNSDPGGGGTDLTGSFAVVATFGANAAEIAVTNNHTMMGYITKLQIRGTPLLTYQTVTMRAEDATSADTYGPHELRLDMPIQDDPEVGQDLAEYLKNVWKEPITQVGLVTILANSTASLMAAALGLDINNQITITESETGLDAVAYFIDGVEHNIAYGGFEHKTTWQLSPAFHSAMWVLGIAGKSELGETTFLGF